MDTSRNVFWGAIKLGFWSIPTIFIMVVGARPIWMNTSIRERKFIIFSVLFSAFYLALVSLVNPTGYRLGPPALFLVLAGAGGAWILVRKKKWISYSYPIFLVLGFGLSIFSLYRYDRMNADIHGSARAVHEILIRPETKTLIVQGAEQSNTVRLLAQSLSLHSTVLLADDVLPLKSALLGRIFLLENSTYFSKYSSTFLADLGSAIGGWSSIEDHGSFRIFIGNSP